ncbi:hypothetical protein [Cribrihabitans pelagius]|uniref:hypothetical protein n=1 Tax=Cribrihabitans pelagius TaxID=1765746 RepID=UPI003B5C1ED4
MTKLGKAPTKARSRVILSTVPIIGLRGLTPEFGEGFTLAGIGRSGVAGLLLNQVLPKAR